MKLVILAFLMLLSLFSEGQDTTSIIFKSTEVCFSTFSGGKWMDAPCVTIVTYINVYNDSVIVTSGNSKQLYTLDSAKKINNFTVALYGKMDYVAYTLQLWTSDKYATFIIFNKWRKYKYKLKKWENAEKQEKKSETDNSLEPH